MVFSSVPLYLDPPNWQQHPNQQAQLQGAGPGNEASNQHLMGPPQAAGMPPQPPSQVGMGGGAGAIRPNSMAERARLAKIPPPEAPLKCPRCESTNTKFCYFNNYSLSQPRHFCKTCRRYWTRGGALRNVPVGGGCRRNKRSSSSSSSKSSSGTGAGGGGSSSSTSKSDRVHVDNLMSGTGGGPLGPTIPGIPSGVGTTTSFMAPLQNIAQLGMGGTLQGLTFGGSLHAASGHHHHHQQHHPLGGIGGLDFNPQVNFPSLLGGFEVPAQAGNSSSALYSASFQNDHQSSLDDHVNVDMNLPKSSTSNMLSSQFAPVKMEDGQGLNMVKQLMGISSSSDNNATSGGNNNTNNSSHHQFWGGNNNMWTDLSGLNSSSTTHLL